MPTRPAREAWIAGIGSIAALDPDNVVAGHKRGGAPDSRDVIEQSEQYLRDFSRVAAESDTAEQIVAAMLELHGDRDNPYTLWPPLKRSLDTTRWSRTVIGTNWRLPGGERGQRRAPGVARCRCRGDGGRLPGESSLNRSNHWT